MAIQIEFYQEALKSTSGSYFLRTGRKETPKDTMLSYLQLRGSKILLACGATGVRESFREGLLGAAEEGSAEGERRRRFTIVQEKECVFGAGRTGFGGSGSSFLNPLELLVASRVAFGKTEEDHCK